MKMTRKEYIAKCKARRLEMRRLRKEGLTLAAIAAMYKVSYQAVQSALRNV